MTRRRMPHPAAVALAVFVTVLWSSSWVIIRLGLDDQELPPLLFAGLRYGTAAAVLWGVTLSNGAARREMRGLRATAAGPLVLLGVVFYTLTQGAQFVAIDAQPAATTSLLLSFTPLVVLVVAGRMLGEPPTGRQVGGAVLAALGAVVYFNGRLGGTAVGMIAATVALAANSAAALLGRWVNRDRLAGPLVTTTLSMTIGALPLVAVGLAVEGWPPITAVGWTIIGWLALVNTALAFTLWNVVHGHLTATETSVLNNTMLVQIALLGWLFLDEPLGSGQVVAIGVVSTGVLLTQLGRRRRPPVVLATRNPAKARAMAWVLAQEGVAARPAGATEYVPVEESGATLEANALLKARAVAAPGATVIAEDSGLFVDALDGRPGTQTGRWASSDDEGARRIVELLADTAERGASFVSAVAAVLPDGRELVATGAVPGSITRGYRGSPGRGYAGIFATADGPVPPNEALPPAPHRRRALERVMEMVEELEGAGSGGGSPRVGAGAPDPGRAPSGRQDDVGEMGRGRRGRGRTPPAAQEGG